MGLVAGDDKLPKAQLESRISSLEERFKTDVASAQQELAENMLGGVNKDEAKKMVGELKKRIGVWADAELKAAALAALGEVEGRYNQ